MMGPASLPLDFSLPLVKQAQPTDSVPQRPAERGPSKSEEAKDFERVLQEQAARAQGQGARALLSGAWAAPVVAESALGGLSLPAPASSASSAWWRPPSSTAADQALDPVPPSTSPQLPDAPAIPPPPEPIAWLPTPWGPPLAEGTEVVPVSALQQLPGVQSLRLLPADGPRELTQLHFELMSPHLGALSLRLEHRGGQVGLELLGHSPESVAQLDAHLHEISGILQAHGLSPTHLRVTQASGAQSGRGAGLSGSDHRGSFMAFFRRRPAQGDGLEAESL